MKKLIIILLIIIIALTASTYIFIPNFISFNKSVLIAESRDGLTRKLYNEKNWMEWWPGAVQKNSTEFIYNNFSYSANKQTTSSILISISNENVSAKTSLNIIPKNFDTTQLIWAGILPTSYNPFERVKLYIESKNLTRNIDNILQTIQSFFSKTENVYDYEIKEESVVDSLLVSTYETSKGYPTTGFIYNLVDQLKKYIADHQAKETGYPMLNVSTNDSIHFLTRVAIPVDRGLPSSATISLKQMPAGGNILVVDVKGGPVLTNEALRQVANYIHDHHMAAPAIPFFSLRTDRRQEPDTSKWETRIYYPVM